MDEISPSSVDRRSLTPWSRQQIAEFLVQRQDKIRALARQHLGGHIGRFADSEDVFSSVCRRLDGVAAVGGLRPRHADEVWALAAAIVSNAAIDRSRMLSRLRSREVQTDGPDLGGLVERCQNDDQAALLFHRMVEALDGDDRQVFMLRVRGASHEVIAQQLNTSVDAARQRWSRIAHTLRGLADRGELIDG
jgi:RNA polymerase sigma factor (sigma-70 family)